MVNFTEVLEHSTGRIKTSLNMAGTYLVPGKICNEDMDGGILVHGAQSKLDFLNDLV